MLAEESPEDQARWRRWAHFAQRGSTVLDLRGNARICKAKANAILSRDFYAKQSIIATIRLAFSQGPVRFRAITLLSLLNPITPTVDFGGTKYSHQSVA